MSNQMKFTGVVSFISQKETGNSKNGAWEKQYVEITEVKDKYPQSILIEAFNKSDEMNKVQVGLTVTAFFNVSSKEYNGRRFGTNSLWKFEPVGGVGVKVDNESKKDDFPF